MSPESRSCAESDRTILLLAGELAGPEATEARAHLEACHVCATLRDDLAAVETAYMEISRVRLPRAELDGMLDRATGAATRQARGGRPSGRTPPAGRSGPSAGAPRRRPALAAAAAVVLFAAGLATGIVLDRSRSPGSSPESSPGTVATTEAADGPASPSPIQRVRYVAGLGGPEMTGSTVSELVSLLATEPNPNVRLAITDALDGADLPTRDQARLLGLLTSEPVAALRIEIIELAVAGNAPGLDTVLTRVARDDDAASVRDFATRTLAALEEL